jgi:hypothetical protein
MNSTFAEALLTDTLHSDDAPEFLSDLLAAVASITGTQRTSTCGHNPQSNGEIESWWRFLNRAMRFLNRAMRFFSVPHVARLRSAHLFRI